MNLCVAVQLCNQSFWNPFSTFFFFLFTNLHAYVQNLNYIAPLKHFHFTAIKMVFSKEGLRLLHGFVFLLCAISAVFATPWNSHNDPKNADSIGAFVYNLAKLPQANSLTIQPWSDTNWPSFQRYFLLFHAEYCLWKSKFPCPRSSHGKNTGGNY